MNAITKRRLTAQEFETAKPYLRISADRLEAARLVMVDGLPAITAAERYGWTQPAVSQCTKKVREAFAKAEAAGNSSTASRAIALPAGWEQITLIAPSFMIAKFRAELAGFPVQDGSTQGEKK
jgi:predicted DNA-binding protein (UPF0251 family)